MNIYSSLYRIDTVAFHGSCPRCHSLHCRKQRIAWKHFRYVVLFVLCGLLLGTGVGPAEVQGYQLPDTGQSKCYDNYGNVINCLLPQGSLFYGQDAQYKGTQPAYRNNGDGTVTDLNTRLMWQQDGGNYGTWQDARYTCTLLNTQGLGGHNDWRIPGRRELVSIVNYGRLDPAINTKFFPATASSSYWSSTRVVFLPLNPYYVWVVNFPSGAVLPAKGNVFSTTRHYVRCVRGNPLPEGAGHGQFINHGNGAITDTATGLVWERQGFPSGRFVPRGTWQRALADCERLTLAGYADWRLPNIRELESLVDLIGNSHPAIDPVFNCCGNPPLYWSSTTWERSPLTAWIVDFSNGLVGALALPYFKNNPGISIRCVRGGRFR
jgi:hypothetical protein